MCRKQGGKSKANEPAPSIAPGFGFLVLAQAQLGFPSLDLLPSLLSLQGKLCSEGRTLELDLESKLWRDR